MPELWGRDAGANRKLRELYARDSVGATRKLRELWGRDAGGVNRRLFSGYDCSAKLGECFGIKNSAINSDGSGRIGVYSTYYEDDPRKYYANIEFYFDTAIAFSVGQEVLKIVSPSYDAALATVSDTANIALFDGIEGSIHSQTNFWTHNPITLNASNSGSSNYFRIYLGSLTLDARSYEDAKASISWLSGNLYICGKQIHNVELI